jgi:hypothetical protein
MHDDPRPQGAITIYRDQKVARNIERDFILGQRNVHCLTTNHEDPDSLRPIKGKKINAQLHSNEGVKKVPLDTATPNQTVVISEDLLVSHPVLRDKAGCISYMRQRRQHI